MEIEYKLNNTILNIVTKFYDIHGRIYASLAFADPQIVKKLINSTSELAAFSAVTKNRNAMDKYRVNRDAKQVKDLLVPLRQDFFYNYLHELEDFENLFPKKEMINTEAILKLHGRLLGLSSEKNKFRKQQKTLSISFIEDDVHFNINSKVSTPPHQIEDKLNKFVDWVNKNVYSINPVVLAAITYLKIAEIHPFQLGNGRISKMLSRGIMYMHDIDNQLLLAIDDYYLKNQHYYYEIIERTIAEKDMTRWIEFFAQGLLHAALQTTDLLYDLSAGTIDVKNNRVIELKENETKVLMIIRDSKNISGAEIGRILGMTRQNVHVILTDLLQKKLIGKIGQNTGARYVYNH